MTGHDFVGGSDELSAYEHSWDRGIAAQPQEGFLHFPAVRILVDFMDSWTHPKFLEQNVDSIAKAA